MYHYLECGLPDVWLVNGYEWVSTSMGKAFRIRSSEALDKAIQGVVVMKPGRLTGGEFRYLRKALNLSQRALADMLGNDEQTVALWEKRRGPPLWADRLIRLFQKEQAGRAIHLRATFGETSTDARRTRAKAARRNFEFRGRGRWHEVSSDLARAA